MGVLLIGVGIGVGVFAVRRSEKQEAIGSAAWALIIAGLVVTALGW